MKYIRITVGSLLVILGLILTIIPGSSFILLAGLVLVSVDYTPARKLLVAIQKSMSLGARKIDKLLLRRKYR